MIWLGIGFSIVAYSTMLVVTIVYSVPHGGHGGWTGARFVSRLNGVQSQKRSVPVCAVGTFIDFYIMTIPLKSISGLKLSRGKKIGLAALFATGLLYVLFLYT